jgi:DNA polymerase epsilon subunit 2
VSENSIVLVEGEAIDGVLHVHNMGSPIVENRADAIKNIGVQNTDIFNSIGSLSELEKLRDQEIEHGQEGMFVVLSDVHLDSPSVIEKIDRMLEGYSDFSPLPIFVFMGNFTSKPLSGGTKAMISYFDDLTNIICKYPNVAKEGRFVFIPGPNDPGITGVLPRGPIPNFFTSSLRSKVKHAIFASNPCRMRFFTKEIVFFRDDLVGKMRRHCLLEPREDNDEDEMMSGGSGQQQLSRHAIKTVLDQSHLSPLPLSASPIYWQHDHALRLYPFPDALIVGDRVDQYYENYEECDAINPGPFSNGFNFVVYRPIGEVEGNETKADVEFSQIE